MDKKDMMLHVINGFEKNVKDIPEELQQTLNTIKEKLNGLSNKQVEMLDGAVTSPAGEEPFEENPVDMLLGAYSVMEKIALSGEPREELTSIIHQMRGLLDTPDRYFP